MMTMMETTLLDELRNEYKIHITDEEYERLVEIMSMYNVNSYTCGIDVQCNMENFINNIHLTKQIKFHRAHTSIELEDVIYCMKPMTYGAYDSIETVYPYHFTKRVNHEVKKIDNKMLENVVLIRTIKYDSRNSHRYTEHYTLMIYNAALDIHAGIRFEKI